MPRSKLPRNVKPGPSNDPADKLYAAMNYRTGRQNKKDPIYLKAPLVLRSLLGLAREPD